MDHSLTLSALSCGGVSGTQRAVLCRAVRGERTVLVDSGPAGSETTLLRGLRRAGIGPDDIGLIVLTHCHPDHPGRAAYLQRELRVPVAVHHVEVEWARSGRSEFYTPVRPFNHVLRHLMAPTFPPVVPDVVLDAGTDLDCYGAPLTVIHTPGHTPGSITVLHRTVGVALVGDLLTGGMLRHDRPNLPFFAQDVTAVPASVHAVLAAAPSRFAFGHGKPSSAVRVLRRFGPLPTPHQRGDLILRNWS